MVRQKNYKKTLMACYLGFVTQAITAVFAFLALAGDLGAAASPTMVGSISELAGGNLKFGLLIATLFPVILVIGLLVLRMAKRRQGKVCKEE